MIASDATSTDISGKLSILTHILTSTGIPVRMRLMSIYCLFEASEASKAGIEASKQVPDADLYYLIE